MKKELTERIQVCCTGSCFWMAELVTDGGLYAVSNDYPTCLSLYALNDRESEDTFMPEDMIFSLPPEQLSEMGKAIYTEMFRALLKESYNYDFPMYDLNHTIGYADELIEQFQEDAESVLEWHDYGYSGLLRCLCDNLSEYGHRLVAVVMNVEDYKIYDLED